MQIILTLINAKIYLYFFLLQLGTTVSACAVWFTGADQAAISRSAPGAHVALH